MTFNYKWTTKKNATHAIQKKDAKGKDAGKGIESNKRQTSNTHFFLEISYKDWESYGNIPQINDILKTITYEYFYKGTNTKSIRQYLTKDDIDKVLHDIENFINKKVKIEITPPARTRNERNKENRDYSKDMKENFIKDYGEKDTEKLLNLTLSRFDKEKEFEKQKKKAKEQIRKINNDLVLLETQTNTDITKIEKTIFIVMRKHLKGYENVEINDSMIKHPTFKKILQKFYHIAKTNKQIDKGNKRQKEYRERKTAESGKPKRKVGRPRKSEI